MTIWERPHECMAREELEQLQLERLQATLNRAYRNVHFYKKAFDAIGFVPEDLDELSGLSGLPFTTREDLSTAYPYEMFAVPLREVVRIHSSSGTSDNPSIVGYTANDLKHWGGLVARLLTAAGVTREDVVQIAFNYGLFTGAFGFHYGAEQVGASVVPTSVGNTGRQVTILRDFRTTALVCTPSYALRIAKVVEEVDIDPKTLSLKLGLFGGECWDEGIRKSIEERLYIKAHDNYGLSEVMGPGVAGECTHRTGMHVSEDHFAAEIIDPDSGKVLPKGRVGELVLTSITKEAFPVIRFRTGDLTSLDDAPCPCGRTLARISRISGRCDNIVIVKGVNIYPRRVGPILKAVTRVEPTYQLVIDRENDMDSLGIRVEVSEAMFFDKMQRQRTLVDRLRKKVRDTIGLTPKIWLVEAGSIGREGETAPMVVDSRKGPSHM
ncbi:MAG: phenylacetate--CoA ligase [Thermodesulfobacteriota bacterium]|nr:phenylacetate--CoA ligase [Thermodesulfobacteriota bacterium]